MWTRMRGMSYRRTSMMVSLSSLPASLDCLTSLIALRMPCRFFHFLAPRERIEIMPSGEEKLVALLKDLQEMATYLHSRGDRTLALSRQFEANAQKDPSSREFDLNQARMLDYQHHIWHEIGNLVEKLIKQYNNLSLIQVGLPGVS